MYGFEATGKSLKKKVICVRLCGDHADWFKIKGGGYREHKRKKIDRKEKGRQRERERERKREILTCCFPFIVCIETCISWGENRCTFYLFIIHASKYILCVCALYALSSVMRNNVSKRTLPSLSLFIFLSSLLLIYIKSRVVILKEKRGSVFVVVVVFVDKCVWVWVVVIMEKIKIPFGAQILFLIAPFNLL